MFTQTLASKIFHFVRGAVRGMNGWEDFSNINFLVIGTDGPGKELAHWFAQARGASVYFTNDLARGLRQYTELLEVEPSVQYLQEGDCIDIIINNVLREIKIKERTFSFDELVEEAYTQGIHAFYL